MKQKIIAAGIAILVVASDLALRASGILDFPLYETDQTIGYIPKASQSGRFMNENDWTFNSLHMGSGEFKPGPQRDVLLVGDSLVYGGNPYKQQERLGPTLERQLQGARVWPIGAGSWSISNELTWLESHPDVVKQVDDIVFVLNNGDLTNTASAWRCERQHPRSHPVSAIWYALNKQFSLDNCTEVPHELQTTDTPWAPRLNKFIQSPEVQGKRILVLMYPDRVEFKASRAQANDLIEKQLQAFPGLKLVAVGAQPGWQDAFYRDGIHPTPQGNEALAKLIQANLN